MKKYVAFSVILIICLSMLGCKQRDIRTIDTSKKIAELRSATKRRQKEEKKKSKIAFIRITKAHEYDSAPAFSPDGTKVAYVS